jgi:hypothetical protein
MTSDINKNHIFSSGMKLGGAKKPHQGWSTPHTYREDTLKRALKWAFLGNGSVPPGHDKDASTVVATEATRGHRTRWDL